MVVVQSLSHVWLFGTNYGLPGSSVHGIYFFIIRMLLPTHSFYQNLPYLLRPWRPNSFWNSNKTRRFRWKLKGGGLTCWMRSSQSSTKKLSLLLVTWLRRNAECEFMNGFPGGSAAKNLPASAGDVGLIPGLGISSGGGNGNPLQYSCVENPMDREAW